jgi:hypothetical protein
VRQVQHGLAHTVEVHVSPAGRETVHRALAGLPGVVSVQLSGEGTGEQWARFVVMPAAETGDVRETIARLLGSLGVICRELRRAEPTLEQVFMRVIESDDRRAAAEGRERTAA